MTNPNKSLVVIILDRSGSMQSIAKDMEGGLNQFIEEQKKLPGECELTFVRFDDEYEKVLDHVPISSVLKLELLPRNSTALYDAIGKAVVETGEYLRSLKEENRPGLVTVMIVTDGGENASREYDSQMVKKLIEQQQNVYNWKFSYLGANQDSFLTAKTLGINTQNVSNYKGKNADKVFRNYSAKFGEARMMASVGNNVDLSYNSQDESELNS